VDNTISAIDPNLPVGTLSFIASAIANVARGRKIDSKASVLLLLAETRCFEEIQPVPRENIK
jgi:hypothetical protein